mmetsp:Transcript_64068/g.202427  ORF Transcript_64068/g.202427 Transcript_64068/m.202427 type:complete len:265 (-) Transcript_64068:256-1050(-)
MVVGDHVHAGTVPGEVLRRIRQSLLRQAPVLGPQPGSVLEDGKRHHGLAAVGAHICPGGGGCFGRLRRDNNVRGCDDDAGVLAPTLALAPFPACSHLVRRCAPVEPVAVDEPGGAGKVPLPGPGAPNVPTPVRAGVEPPVGAPLGPEGLPVRPLMRHQLVLTCARGLVLRRGDVEHGGVGVSLVWRLRVPLLLGEHHVRRAVAAVKLLHVLLPFPRGLRLHESRRHPPVEEAEAGRAAAHGGEHEPNEATNVGPSLRSASRVVL